MSRLDALGERRLIGRLGRAAARTLRSGPLRVDAGIGDDAAVLGAPPGGRGLLLASDMLVEGVHFDRRHTAPEAVGWKALACNVSDIAAMGGRPAAAVVSLGAPASTPPRWIARCYAGLIRCAARFGTAIVGGDTVRAPCVVIDVAILGVAPPRGAVRRDGARPGDRLCVTGRLGGSYRSGRHAVFTPRVAEAQALVARCRPSAMIDVSDGLASDAWQLARASRVTLRIRTADVPVAPAAGGVNAALNDGEDFELLFTVRPGARVPRRIGRCPVREIGRAIRRGAGVELEDASGRVRRVRAGGFEHFRKGRRGGP
ncbi:MAG TPA: thiamine-phosphate kinase [bacterium]